MAATFQIGFTDRAKLLYDALNLPFAPQVDFADQPQVGSFIAFGPTPVKQWFSVINKEYYFLAAGYTLIQYMLDVYPQPAV